MKLMQDLIIFVAKILIFIGDATILFFSFFWKILKIVFDFAKTEEQKILIQTRRLRNKLPHRVIEREIYSAKEKTPIINLPDLKLPEFSKPSLPPVEFRLPEFNLQKINKLLDNLLSVKIPDLDLELPKIKIPKISIERVRIVVPSPKLPSLNIPSVKLPSLHLPRIKLPSFTLPKIHAPHRKKVKKRIQTFIPFTVKFKYLFIGTFFSFVLFFMPAVFVIFVQNLPNPAELSHQEIAQTTKIYDRNGALLYQIYANQNRTVIPLSEIPENLQEATIAIEDKNFYNSPGIDFMAIVRSAVADFSGRPLQGGSTITQQLIKTRLLTPERSIERKVKEVILAVWTERVYNKSQILEMYFNQVPYGGTSWGIEAAAQTYFGKDAKDLDLAQSAFLAGLPQAPSVYSPYAEDPNAWRGRQAEVLKRMVDLKYISKAQEQEAKNEKLTFKPAQQILHAPHFVMYVKDQLVDKYGLAMVERGGLNVVTSLDLKTQDMAQKIITDEVDNAGYLHFTNAGALITDPKNGDIIAMVGGKDYYDPKGGNFNVTTALRQPGSTIKVITYSAALMNGYTAATAIQDSPVSFASAGAPPYTPVNYDGRFHGTVSLRNALGNSINIPAVKTLNQVGIGTMVNLAKNMGISTWGEPQDYGLALTLGAAEVKMTDMATAYGTLANQGEKVDLNPILKITDYQGNVLEDKSEIKEKSVMPQNIAFIISNILADNNARAMEFGLNSPLKIPGHTVSVKTGTTDNKRDNWTIGYTPNLLTAVWVGNNDNTPMNPILASGITGAAPIWNKIMNNLLSRYNPKDEIYTPPADIVVKPCSGKNEYFVKGTENQANCRPISIIDQKPN